MNCKNCGANEFKNDKCCYCKSERTTVIEKLNTLTPLTLRFMLGVNITSPNPIIQYRVA